MSDKIDYILEHDRFPLAKIDRIFMGGIFLFIIALAILAFNYLDNPWAITGVGIFALLLCFAIYNGFISSLVFKKIGTGFSQEQNKKLIILCMNHLNFKLFNDQKHDNAFVCFVHKKGKSDRQEIYLIAKDKYILINSNKDKEAEDEPGTIDFVDKIGMTIYKTAISLRKRSYQ